MTLTSTHKTLIVTAGVAIAILLLVKIIGWNRITAPFNNRKTEQISQLKERIKQDSVRVVLMGLMLEKQKDSAELYQKLYKQSKINYVTVTRYYEKRIGEVKALSSKETIAYFDSRTQCGDRRDTNVITRLSSMACANVLFAERDMFLAQRDTLNLMNGLLEEELGFYKDMNITQQDLIDLQRSSISKYLDIVNTQETVLNDLEKEKKKTDKKIKRTKTFAIIGSAAAVVLAAVLILQ